MDSRIAEAIRQSAAVPSMPRVVTRFLEVIQDPNFEYDAVVKVLSVDAGTVSEILRLANSALFGVSRKVISLKQALTLLGPRRTRSLVLGRYLVEAIGNGGAGPVDTSYFWRRSLSAAVLGARIADVRCPRQRDEVFLCALLADIGVTILAQALPEEYRIFAECYAPHGAPMDVAAERAALGTTHAEVSASVLAEWALPEAMCSAVEASHDAPGAGEGDASGMAGILNASDRIAKLLCEIPDVTTCATICIEAMEIAGAEPGILTEILSAVEKDIEELALILHIDVIPGSVYGSIADAIKDKLSLAAR